MQVEPQNPIVWIGRFKGSSGYASATRGCFNALMASGRDVIGIDINTLDIFGNMSHAVKIVKHKDNVDLQFQYQEIANVVIHEVPERWGQVEFHGQTSLTGYTVTEVEQLPIGWQEDLPIPHRLWTASNFNKDIFNKHFLGNIDIVYHFVDYQAISQSKDNINIGRLTNRFKVLHVASNFNRKDTASAIKAYVRAFYNTNDTSLVIKLPEKTKEEEIQKFIYEAVFPEVDISKNDFPHISVICSDLSNEELWALYSEADVTLVTERAKGFDLISAEAMAAGCPTIAVGWGANLEFMTHKNSYLLKSKPNLVAVDHSLIVNEDLYGTGMWAAFDIEDAVLALSDVYHRPGIAQAQASKAQRDVESLLGRSNVVRQMQESFSNREPWETAGFAKPRVRIWEKGRNRVRELSALRQTSYEKLQSDERALFERDPNESAFEYIEKRRPLWGKYGCVMPPAVEISRTSSLRNQHLGKSIFVMGNGPSLRLIDFDQLIGVPTFAANRISLAFDKTAWRPTFFTALDWLVSPDNYQEYDDLPPSITRFLPFRFHGLMKESETTFWYESTSGGMHSDSKFQGDASQAIRGAGTVVTAMLQLAWHLGFRRFFLLGCNASYSVPSTVKQSGGDRFGNGVQLKLESTRDDDPNHFDPRYFGAGKKWHDPNVDEMKRGFRTSQLAIERMGGSLIDCTEGGKLDFLPKMSFETAVSIVRTENDKDYERP